MRNVGGATPRQEGVEKLTGRALYLDDLSLPGLLHGRTIRSPVARGRLEGIDLDPALRWAETVVVTASDIPGRNLVALMDSDQPCLAVGRLLHREEPVALLAHADPGTLERAVAGVRLRVTSEPAVMTLDQALAGESPLVPGNLFSRHTLSRGDLEQGFAEADLVVEGVYETPAQEHLYIEPQAMLATPRKEGGITVWGSLQCPHYVRRAVATVLGLEEPAIQVIQTTTGGGFGGKEEYPSMIACHAALLAWKAQRPVKLVYSRAEDMRATTKRHPSRTRLRVGVRRDGRLTALEADLLLDGGAYSTLSPVVLSRAMIHLTGVYRWPHLRVQGRMVATNTPPHGAFRGFGAPQVTFALETHLDRVARELGLDPIEIRRRNLLRAGDRTATGQLVDGGDDPTAVLDAALRESAFEARRAEIREANGRSLHVKRGLGLSTFFHGAGFTGAGELVLGSVAGVRVSPEGEVEIQASSVEMGQGTAVALTQIVGEALGIPPDWVRTAAIDTSRVPDSGPTVASRTVMVVGQLLLEASGRILERLRNAGDLPIPHDGEDFLRAARRYHRQHPALEETARFRPPPGWSWDARTLTGDAYASYAWGCYVAEVSVDVRTGEVALTDFVATQEVGRVVHPVTARGQIHGGVAQGVGFALFEDVLWQDGVMANHRLTDYLIPTAAEMPPVRVLFLEAPHPRDAFGAKGLGELPMDGTAPAIVNAINHALGTEISALPARPERVLEALGKVGAE